MKQINMKVIVLRRFVVLVDNVISFINSKSLKQYVGKLHVL